MNKANLASISKKGHTCVCLANLREKQSLPIFLNEIEKQCFLNQLSAIWERRNARMYAYCLLDGEAFLLLDDRNKQHMKKVLREVGDSLQEMVRGKYGEQEPHIECVSYWEKTLDWKNLMEACIWVHMLPVEKNYTERASDYWWSSYRDYCLNRKSGLTETKWLLQGLADKERRAVSLFSSFHNTKTNQKPKCDRIESIK